MSCVTTFLPGGPGLQADVEVVAVELTESLVEAQLANRPGRHGDHEPVDGVHLAGLAVRRDVVAVPGRSRDAAASVLPVAMLERRPGHGPLPPRDAPDPDRPGAPDYRHLGIGERLPQPGTEIRIDDLGILMEQDERLEVIAVGDLVQDDVVVAEDRTGELVVVECAVGIVEPRARHGDDLGVGLGGELDPGLGAAAVDLGVGYRAAESDHRLASLDARGRQGGRYESPGKLRDSTS